MCASICPRGTHVCVVGVVRYVCMCVDAVRCSVCVWYECDIDTYMHVVCVHLQMCARVACVGVGVAQARVYACAHVDCGVCVSYVHIRYVWCVRCVGTRQNLALQGTCPAIIP